MSRAAAVKPKAATRRPVSTKRRKTERAGGYLDPISGARWIETINKGVVEAYDRQIEQTIADGVTADWPIRPPATAEYLGDVTDLPDEPQADPRANPRDGFVEFMTFCALLCLLSMFAAFGGWLVLAVWPGILTAAWLAWAEYFLAVSLAFSLGGAAVSAGLAFGAMAWGARA